MSRCLLVGLGALLLAQKPYFQQRVEYRIQVKLFPIENLLRGYLRLTYQNNSPDTLSGLYFHLWPNAYSRRGTAFDRQQRIMGKTSFYFAAKEERGFMDSLSFQVEGETVKPLPAAKGPAPATGHSLSLLRRTPDVVWVPFPRPLPPGKAVVVETPFRVKIPKTFSRMGRQGLQYAITQWYPKPAVYDHKGWHPLPYLDQGEFYSEWGKYEVEIEVPENFFVAATGRLETPEVQKWIQQRETETRRWIEQHPQESGITEEGVRRIRLPFVGFNIQTPAVGSITSADLPTWARDTSIAPSYKKLRFVQD
ncbi:MAG: hypothetical protein N2170_09005, partial [Bacteroidia bacterium]|nr:hypothetical protein [Bacteroidia bacterium]